MSRFDFDNDDWTLSDEALWMANIERAIHGKRGQKALRALEQALLALPEKRLIAGALLDENGEVCPLGALWRQRCLTRGEAVKLPDNLVDEDGLYQSIEIGMTYFGMTKVLANTIAYQNDEARSDKTPEERYTRMLAWVRAQLEE